MRNVNSLTDFLIYTEYRNKEIDQLSDPEAANVSRSLMDYRLGAMTDAALCYAPDLKKNPQYQIPDFDMDRMASIGAAIAMLIISTMQNEVMLDTQLEGVKGTQNQKLSASNTTIMKIKRQIRKSRYKSPFQKFMEWLSGTGVMKFLNSKFGKIVMFVIGAIATAASFGSAGPAIIAISSMLLCFQAAELILGKSMGELLTESMDDGKGKEALQMAIDIGLMVAQMAAGSMGGAGSVDDAAAGATQSLKLADSASDATNALQKTAKVAEQASSALEEATSLVPGSDGKIGGSDLIGMLIEAIEEVTGQSIGELLTSWIDDDTIRQAVQTAINASMKIAEQVAGNASGKADGAADALDDAADAAKDASKAIDKVGDNLENVGEQLDDIKDQLKKLRDEFDNIGDLKDFDKFNENVAKTGDAINNLKQQLGDSKKLEQLDELNKISGEFDQVREASSKFGEIKSKHTSVDDVEKLNEFGDKRRDLWSAIDEHLDASISLASSPKAKFDQDKVAQFKEQLEGFKRKVEEARSAIGGEDENGDGKPDFDVSGGLGILKDTVEEAMGKTIGEMLGGLVDDEVGQQVAAAAINQGISGMLSIGGGGDGGGDNAVEGVSEALTDATGKATKSAGKSLGNVDDQLNDIKSSILKLRGEYELGSFNNGMTFEEIDSYVQQTSSKIGSLKQRLEGSGSEKYIDQLGELNSINDEFSQAKSAFDEVKKIREQRSGLREDQGGIELLEESNKLEEELTNAFDQGMDQWDIFGEHLKWNYEPQRSPSGDSGGVSVKKAEQGMSGPSGNPSWVDSDASDIEINLKKEEGGKSGFETFRDKIASGATSLLQFIGGTRGNDQLNFAEHAAIATKKMQMRAGALIGIYHALNALAISEGERRKTETSAAIDAIRTESDALQEFYQMIIDNQMSDIQTLMSYIKSSYERATEAIREFGETNMMIAQNMV